MQSLFLSASSFNADLSNEKDTEERRWRALREHRAPAVRVASPQSAETMDAAAEVQPQKEAHGASKRGL